MSPKYKCFRCNNRVSYKDGGMDPIEKGMWSCYSCQQEVHDGAIERYKEAGLNIDVVNETGSTPVLQYLLEQLGASETSSYQIAVAIGNGAKYFITNDETLRPIRGYIKLAFDIEVVYPVAEELEKLKQTIKATGN